MPILVDYSQATISVVFQQIDYKGNLRNQDSWDFDRGDTEGFSPDLMRHVLLNNILYWKRRFSKVYGEFIFCVDSKTNWRADVFSLYKWSRKELKKQRIFVDWDQIHALQSQFGKELRKYFNYKVIGVRGAEADDLIGVLSKHFSNEGEKTLIISSDKDFKQLQRYPGVLQYSPMKRDYLEEENPTRFLTEQIIRGDRGDGIPNIFSPLNCFKKHIKMKRVMSKTVEKWLNSGEEFPIWDEATNRRYHQNRILIDLDCTPPKLKTKILAELEKLYTKDETSSKVLSSTEFTEYFFKNGLSKLFESIGEF